MEEIKNMKSIYSQKNRLYLDWDIDLKCNYSCTYCFQKFNNRLNKYYPNINKNINILLNLLKKHPLDFTLGLLGGEPTLNEKNYFNILNYFNNFILPDKPKSEIYVSTNISKDLIFYKNHPKYHNIYQWVSIHPEYFDTLKKIDTLFLKMEYLMEKSPDQFIISPMLYIENNMSFFEKIYNWYLLKKDSNNIIYSPQLIFINSTFIDIQKNFDLNNPIFNNSLPEFIINDSYYTLNEIIQKPKQITNKLCEYNYYHISPDLQIHGSCNNINFNIKKYINKFLTLKPEKIKCHQQICIDFPKMLSEKI